MQTDDAGDTPRSGDETGVRRVLVTGATGYVGGRLVPRLLAAGYDVVCLARPPARLRGRGWRDDVTVVEGDALDAADLDRAMEGVDAAYYLMHSMDGTGDFSDRDRRMARLFREAAERADVGHLVYLGGLGRSDEELSAHLSSRQEVGRILGEGPIPVTELRAAMVIGSGSASFEMLRNLVDVLPVMITPRWVRSRCQPIAIRDVLHYLVASLSTPDVRGQVLEIGGPEVMTYRELMDRYAELAGLRKRLIIGVPLLTPELSSHWINLVTPLPKGLAVPLVHSLKHDVVVSDDRVDQLLPHDCLRFDDAVGVALRRVQDLEVPTTWSSAETSEVAADPLPEDPDWSGGTILQDERIVDVAAPPEVLFDVVEGIGGERGYFVADALWGIRGLLDTVVGGVGKARGRRHPNELYEGEALDWWRVETLEEPHLLRLSAEMKVPGSAWLEWRVEPREGGSRLEQRARMHPRGLWGRLYWYVLIPFHAVIFPKMAQRIAAAAEEQAREQASGGRDGGGASEASSAA